MHRCRTLLPILLVALTAPACGKSQTQLKLEAAEAEAVKLRDENARLGGEVTRKAAAVATSRAEAKSLNAALADAQARVEAAERRIAAIAKEPAKDKRVQEDLDRVTAHRDELKEWIEQDLLPAAEKNSPELVNLREATESMMREVTAIRGLEWKHPIMRRRIRRAQVGEWMQRDMKKDLPEEKARDMVLVGAEMGLVKQGTNIYDIFASFLEAGAAAFYKPETRTFYHIEGNDGRGAYPVVFHELVHAVEDQYFDLDAFYRAVEGDGDAALARRGLVEGTASWFGEQYEMKFPADAAAMAKSQMTPELMQKQMKMMQTVPAFLIATMGLYPYKNGKSWVGTVTGGDSAKVAAAFADPPASTEQILHPEKYSDATRRDYPHKVAAPDLSSALPGDWRTLESDTMGELMTGCLLSQLRFPGPAALMGVIDMATQGYGIKEPTKTAVTGWDGDRYSAVVDPANGRATLCWVSVWDSEQDATEFVAAYAPLVGKKVTGAKVEGDAAGQRFAEKDTGRLSSVVREGTKVVAVLGAPADRFDAVLAAGMSAKVEADSRDASDR